MPDLFKKSAYIFDSFSLLRLFQKEPGYEKIIKLLKHIETHRLFKYLNAINMGEIIYISKREFGNQYKLEILAQIERLEFIILPVTNELIFQAAELKADYSISYADCFLLASAIQNQAIIVTGDPEFKKVESLAEIIWV
ncbi:MAG: type II toxin-antitoxin system VapC family toxin [Candidatus Schekmanbacteria bacterium]|nr:type II toxin-antitoxin system VapC family toxin [Candidatus Schekmanbacteria bacterium]